MNPDGFDDVRLLLHDADPGPVPPLDVEEILDAGRREQRRAGRARWYAVAAVVLVVTAVGVVVASLAGRPHAVQPADPVTSSPNAGFAPTPQSPDQWLLYAQPAVDTASSVHVVEALAPGVSDVSVDAVLGVAGAEGVVTGRGATSRYRVVDGVTYVEPAVLERLGLVTATDVGSATWVRLTGRRFPLPGSVRDAVNLADASRWSPTYGEDRVVDGQPTTAIAVDVTELAPGARLQTFYLATATPHLPLLITRDGQDIARYTAWNAPVTTPVAPPAADVAAVAGL